MISQPYLDSLNDVESYNALNRGEERFSKNHQHMYIAYFFDANSKNHIHFVQK